MTRIDPEKQARLANLGGGGATWAEVARAVCIGVSP